MHHGIWASPLLIRYFWIMNSNSVTAFIKKFRNNHHLTRCKPCWKDVSSRKESWESGEVVSNESEVNVTFTVRDHVFITIRTCSRSTVFVADSDIALLHGLYHYAELTTQRHVYQREVFFQPEGTLKRSRSSEMKLIRFSCDILEIGYTFIYCVLCAWDSKNECVTDTTSWNPPRRAVVGYTCLHC